MSKRAVILAGGKGKRLHPYTVVLPKPLMPIGEYPILEVVVRQLVSCGFDHITMAVNHQADIIKSYFNAGRDWGARIDFSLEKEFLSTMGPLTLIDDLPEDFLVMNGDILTDMDFGAFYDGHVQRDEAFSISSFVRRQRSEFGVLTVSPEKRLQGFREKPEVEYEVSMGVYMLSRRVLDHIPKGKPFGFDDLMHGLLDSDFAVGVRRYEGFWLDIGRQDDYAEAIDMFEVNKHLFLK
ncbi:MAG: nucleotidyltransferase family protein [Pseudodesulfovibrio sp.]|nr:nucleotidyltransferase family protein [Pseudodesulfovibrio sp.]